MKFEVFTFVSLYGFFTAMPTFTAIALDRLLEPGASKSVDKSVPISMPVPNSQKLERTTSVPTTKNKLPPRSKLKPALYTTPEVTPLPGSPSSFAPSPYIINHKRRGPRLLKSASEPNVLSEQTVLHDGKVNGKNLDTVVAAGDLQVMVTNPEPVKDMQMNVNGGELNSSNDGDLGNGHRETGSNSMTNGLHMENILVLNSERDREIEDLALNSERVREIEDFFDPQESMSFTSNTDGEENAGTELSVKFSSPGGEFYDAWEGKLCQIYC